MVLLAGCSSSSSGPELASSEQALSTGLVISQVYGGAGNAGTIYNSDFIEIFNRGTTSVSVSGWSLQYAAAAGASWTVTALPAKTIPAGGYFLVQMYTDTAGGGLTLPTSDATGTSNLSALSGKVALVSSSTALTCTVGCATASGVVDFVGYGAATAFEGSGAAPPGTILTSPQRKGSGCTETDDNSADFASSAPVARNSSASKTSCGLDAGADTAPVDTGTPDTAPPDTSMPDTSMPDTSMPDTSIPDTSMPDTSAADTSVADTAPPDTSVDDVAIADSAQPDTEPELDATPLVDASEADTRVPGGGFDLPAAKPACSCDTPGRSGGSGLFALAALAIALVRRRR